MEKTHYWFVDRACRIPHMVSLISPYDQYDTPRTKIELDYDPFNLNTQQSIDILMSLFERGFLLGIMSGDLDEVDDLYINSLHAPTTKELSVKGFIPSREEVRKSIEHKEVDSSQSDCFTGKRLFYFLTPKGGQLWESIFKPKWNLYRTAWRTGDFNIINCTNINTIKKLISIQHFINYKPDRCSLSLPSGTEVWQELTPWQGLYWKSFPTAYSVSFQTSFVETDEHKKESEQFMKEMRKANEWYKHSLKWYQKNYFDDWLDYPVKS